MPPGVVFAVAAGDSDACGALLERDDRLERVFHLDLGPHDADLVLHHRLQFVLDLVGAFGGAALERLEGPPRRPVHLRLVDRARAVLHCELGRRARLARFLNTRVRQANSRQAGPPPRHLRSVDRARAVLLRELGRVLARPLSEHEQVRQRVAAEPVRSVQPRGALAGREQARNGRHLRVAVDLHAAHHVVRCRADLHRRRGDVDVGKLLELVVHAGQLLLDVLCGVRQPLRDPRDVEQDAAVRGSAALLDFAHDAARDVVAREQLRRAARVAVALGVAPALLGVVGGLGAVVLGDVVEHEPAAFAVDEDAAFAAHALGDEDAAHAWRPHHAGRVELDELHVHQVGAGVVGERVAVAGVFPTITRDAVGAPDAAGRQHDRLALEQAEPAAFAVVSECACDAVAVLEQRKDGVLHVDLDPLVDPVVLKRADHLEAGPVADVRETRVLVAAKVALQDPPFLGPVKERAPRLELADAVGRFLGVEFGHAPVVDVLAAAHGVGKVDPPAVALVDVCECRGDAAFGHDGVRLAEQRFADHADGHAAGCGFDGRAESGAAGADDENVVFVGLVVGHQWSPPASRSAAPICRCMSEKVNHASCQMPLATRRT